MGQDIKIIKKNKKRKSSRAAWSKEREAQYKELVSHLEEAGYVVRREELKRGHCWKVVSGECRSQQQKLIFVDSRLSPDEQVGFLSVKWQELHPVVDEDEVPVESDVDTNIGTNVDTSMGSDTSTGAAA